MSNSSFYQNGLPVSTAATGVGNVTPATPVPNPAQSSFYLNGSIYQTLANQDQLLALLLADSDLVAADLVASNLAAANAAASQEAAAASLVTLNTTALLKANNLSDLSSVPTALVNIGLNNVNNTSDANKPVSTAQATADALVASNAAAATLSLTNATTAALALKAPLASPALTGVPVAPTAAPGTATTQLATTAFVDAARVILVAADALKAPLASPALTGAPTAPTATALTNSTVLATTAYANAADAVVTTAYQAADALKAPLASPALTGVPTAPTATTGTNTTQLATTAFVIANATSAGVSSIAGNSGAFTLGDGLTNTANVLKVDPQSVRGYLSGLTLSTAGSSATFGVSVGVAVDSTSADFMKLASAFTKTNAAWSLGTAGGSFDGTGAAPTATAGWYHVFLIKRTDTGVVDVLTSLSATVPTLPTSYTLFRRIASVKSNSSFQWTAFTQNGDKFYWLNNATDAAAVAVTTTTANTIALSVPPGVQVDALFHGAFNPSTSANGVLFTALEETDVAVLGLTGSRNASLWAQTSAAFQSGDFVVRSNTSSQIRWRAFGTTGSPDVSIYTYGWIDNRGKLA